MMQLVKDFNINSPKQLKVSNCFIHYNYLLLKRRKQDILIAVDVLEQLQGEHPYYLLHFYILSII